MVPDRIRDTSSVIRIPSTMTPASSKADKKEENMPAAFPIRNMDIMDKSMGNLPLQGTKLLVIMAISRSLGESIIRHPVTPTALQPNPMHIVSACLPQAWHLWKQWSRLNATLGRYPRSSSSVNNGKNIAIGGSITDTTQAATRYTP